MLPYTPLHHLLCHDVGRPLVLTSGNRSDEPIAIDDEEARRRLGEIADAFLSHDRPIHRRCEDSVVRAGIPGSPLARVTRPGRCRSPCRATAPIVAAGAELKSTFCVARGAEAFLSPHLGDLDSEAAYVAFRADLALYLDMLGVEPAAIACDLHPEYLSTKWAGEQGLPLSRSSTITPTPPPALQSTARPARRSRSCSTARGYGTDGTLWGGEVLRCDLASFERVAHLEPVPLPGRRGGDQGAVAYGRRVPRARRTAGPVRALAARAREPQGQRAALLGSRTPVRRGRGAPRRARDGVATRARRQSSWSNSPATRWRRPIPAPSTAARSAAPTSSRPHSTTWRRAGREPRSQRPSTKASQPRSQRPARRRAARDGGALGRQLPEPSPARLAPQPPRGRGVPRPLAPPRSSERRRRQLRSGCCRSRNAWSLVCASAFPDR